MLPDDIPSTEFQAANELFFPKGTLSGSVPELRNTFQGADWEDALVRLFFSLARGVNTTVLLDDIHLADDSSSRVFRLLMAANACEEESRVRFVWSASAQDSDWVSSRAWELEGWEKERVVHLAEKLVGGYAFGEDLGNRLAKIAGGNPGRVVRLMGRWLKEDWVVIRGGVLGPAPSADWEDMEKGVEERTMVCRRLFPSGMADTEGVPRSSCFARDSGDWTLCGCGLRTVSDGAFPVGSARSSRRELEWGRAKLEGFKHVRGTGDGGARPN